MDFTVKEILVLVIGTTLAFASFKSDDPLIFFPCIGLSWASFVYICASHPGSIYPRFVIAAVISCAFVFLCFRTYKPSAESKKEIESHLPGLSLNIGIRIHHLAVNRRKYIFDFGKAEGERLSIYISPDNVFTLSFIDAKGEPHPVQVPIGANGIPLDDLIYLSCEVGVSGESTIADVRVNGRRVGALKLPFRADIGSLDVPNGVVGANLDGHNGAAFDLGEVAIYSSTLGDNDLNGRVKYFTRPRNSYVQFNGYQWMRFDKVASPDQLTPTPPSPAPDREEPPH